MLLATKVVALQYEGNLYPTGQAAETVLDKDGCISAYCNVLNNRKHEFIFSNSKALISVIKPNPIPSDSS